MNHQTSCRRILLLYILLWVGLNLLFLTDYPFMHTDEPWLSGLSRTMMAEGTLNTTESFYDLYERNPHALKILFHVLQIGMIRLFGYSLFTVRLLSLITGGLCLHLTASLIRRLTDSPARDLTALLTVVWMSLDIQFIYASHTARQEIQMTALMLASLNILSERRIPGVLRGGLTGLIIGLSAGFHPNGFLIAWPAGLYLLTEILLKKRSLREGSAFIAAAALSAGVFVLISFHFNPDFLTDYARYGEPLGVLDAPDVKFLRWPRFYRQLYGRIAGTYHLPDIRWQMITFPLLLIAAVPAGRLRLILCGLGGFNIGLVLLGKYSQPSVLFLLPFYYLTAAAVIGKATRYRRRALPVLLWTLLAGTTLFFSLREIRTEMFPRKERESYSEYQTAVRRLVPPEATILAGLNTEFAVEYGHLRDWRNLALLKEAGLTFGEYVRSRKIEYILVPEELEYIYESRPRWNVLYGNIAPWYGEMQDFLESDCLPAGDFPSPGCGVRIAALRYRREWRVRVYKVLSAGSISE